MKKLTLIFLVVLVAGCASHKKDRHEAYYEGLQQIAQAQADERKAELQMKIELVRSLFGTSNPSPPTSGTPVRWNPYQQSDLARIMAVMLIFNDKQDPRSLSYAIQEVQSPLPSIGERITDGVFRTLPVALGIAGAAYGGYLINKAGEYGALTAIENAPQTVNNTTTSEHYNVNSYNSQEANMGQSNSGGAGPGGSRNTNSGNQGNAGLIGQSQDFSANNPAMRSPGYQAPFNEPVTAGPIPVVLP
jgi:hypothetical protein